MIVISGQRNNDSYTRAKEQWQLYQGKGQIQILPVRGLAYQEMMDLNTYTYM